MEEFFAALTREDRDAVAVIICSLISRSGFSQEHSLRENALEET